MENEYFTSIQTNEGVKRLYEPLLKDGRTFVVTDKKLPASNFPNGNLFVETDDVGLYHLYYNHDGIKQHLLPHGLFDNHKIDSNLLAELSVEGKHIRHNSISLQHILDNNIITSKLQDRCVTSNKIAEESILNEHVAINSLNGNRIENGSVSGEKLTAQTISGDKLKSATLEGAHFKPQSIDGLALAPQCISSENLGPQIISSEHLAANSIATNHLQNNSIENSKIKDLAISSRHLSERCVLDTHISEKSIKNEHLSLNCISLNNLDANLQERIARFIEFTDNTCTIPGYLNVQQSITCTYLNASNNVSAESITTKSNTVIGGNLEVKGKAIIQQTLHVSGNITSNGKVYNAGYNNDLAEAYLPGTSLAVGQIVALHEDGKIYPAEINDKCIVGVVSETYATCYGASETELAAGKKVAVGLIGRVPIKVVGKVHLGDTITTIFGGYGVACKDKNALIVGMALENEKDGFVTCLIAPTFTK